MSTSKKVKSGMNELRYTVPITECEVLESDGEKPTKARIGGVCLVPTISRNNNKYTVNNIKENDGKEVKLFIQEHGELEVKNIVGRVNLCEKEGKLHYDGIIRNTQSHPDIIEHARENEIDISIDARAKGKKIIKEGDKYVRSYESIDVRALCGVGVGGLPQNSMEYVIAESLDKGEELVEQDKVEESTIQKVKDTIKEENKMEESEKMTALLKEMEELKAKVKEQESELDKVEKEKMAEAEKQMDEVIEAIKKVKKDVSEKELRQKPLSELKLILEYEKKLKENEDEGGGEVEPDKEEEAPSESDNEDIIVEKERDEIYMSEKGYEKYRKELESSVYR